MAGKWNEQKKKKKMEFHYFVIGFLMGATVFSMLATHEMNKSYDKYEKMLDDIRKEDNHG